MEKQILVAEPKLSKELGKWIIAVTKDGEKLPLGHMINSLIFKYISFVSREEAIQYIKSNSRLSLKVGD